MVKQNQAHLTAIFGALANPQRRQMVDALAEQPRTISQLAEPLGLSLPAIHKHVKALEAAKLVDRRRVGRSHELVLRVRALAEAEAWIEEHRAYWNRQFDALENYIDTKKEN